MQRWTFTHFHPGHFWVNSRTPFCYGLPVLVSDIPANREVELPAERYFRCGDVDDLEEKMRILLDEGWQESEKQAIQSLVIEKYNSDRIAEQTIEVYRKVIAQRA